MRISVCDKRNVFVLFLLCVFSFSLVACSFQKEKSKATLSSKDVQQIENERIENGDVPEDKYGDLYVSVSGAKVEYFESYSGKKLGLFGYTITNNGDKTLKNITLVIVYRDSSGNDVSEESVCVLDRFGDPLKPGHSFSIDDGEFAVLSEPPPNAVISTWRIDTIKVSYDK